jgi:hypothetical protein
MTNYQTGEYSQLFTAFFDHDGVLSQQEFTLEGSVGDSDLVAARTDASPN